MVEPIGAVLDLAVAVLPVILEAGRRELRKIRKGIDGLDSRVDDVEQTVYGDSKSGSPGLVDFHHPPRADGGRDE